MSIEMSNFVDTCKNRTDSTITLFEGSFTEITALLDGVTHQFHDRITYRVYDSIQRQT